MKSYPAGYDEVIAVAATDQNDQKAWFSNWGDWIELAAPGVDIYSTVPWRLRIYERHFYGLPTRCRCSRPCVEPDIQTGQETGCGMWLRYTADDLGDIGFDVYYGYGRVNARKAVERSPPAHELIAYDWTTPPYIEPGTSGIINATVLNFGER